MVRAPTPTPPAPPPAPAPPLLGQPSEGGERRHPAARPGRDRIARFGEQGYLLVCLLLILFKREGSVLHISLVFGMPSCLPCVNAR